MDQYQKKFKAYLEKIVAKTPAKTSDDRRRFVRQFYDKMPIMEIETLTPEHACTIANTSYDFIKQRKMGGPTIRIHTPDKKKYGWDTEKTVIEILNDDMPFLVDSITAELARHEISVHALYHPVFSVTRDQKGKLQHIHERADDATDATSQAEEGAHAESFMHIQVPCLTSKEEIKRLETSLYQVLEAVRLAVIDWRAILGKMDHAILAVEQAPASFLSEDVQEVKDFMHWLVDNNFIFLGYLEYEFPQNDKNGFKAVPNSELGLFKLKDKSIRPQGLDMLPREVIQYARRPELVDITKANVKSVVHRPIHMDYIAVKRFDKDGNVIGEHRFLGLFTSRVYYQSADDIPILRRKIARTLERANFSGSGHNGKALKAIMEFYPRDELFQVSEAELFQTAMGILSLDARPDVRLFTRNDLFERFVSCMLYVPRERFSTSLRENIQNILEEAYEGKVTAYYTQVGDTPLARVHLIVRTQPGKVPDVDLRYVESEISRVTNLWSDALHEVLLKKHGPKDAGNIFRLYKNAFPSNYIAYYGPDSAVYDITKIDDSIRSGNLALDLFRKRNDAKDFVRLKVYNPHDQVPLSDILPMLENMGFRVIDENPYHITPHREKERSSVWVRDLRLTMPDVTKLNIQEMKGRFEEVLARVWHGQVENDGFNALVSRAELGWRDIVLLRAYSKYLKQTGLPYNQQFIVQALSDHPQTTRKLVELFYARFDPSVAKSKRPDNHAMVQSLYKLLSNVSNLAQDRVLRLFINVIESTLRTNFFQTDENGNPKDYISFKFDSKALSELPLPRPYREIFVYSMRIEGIHLRGGRVARGGLRWSDRHEDFRTEVLGLMKAQMVKNAIIVPVGSKGGFVVKQPPKEGGRDAFMAEGIECYKTFLRGLLDITDNIVKGKVSPPKNVVRHDKDDPYLVVAADKGTATFSDIANGISAEYGFWLGDAFASGGSAGYDHKGMGITARGAWVSVERHFNEMGKDTAKEDFTVVGIGDMAGDVFGNGMLLSKHIRLVGAFNHLHIFVDPNPDAASSFKERQRLFNLPRSSWEDYNKKLISKGGGIYSRSDKSVPISKETREALGLDSDVKTMTPDELIKAMLKAPVGLLWNGGIGTYVKSKHESHDDVGDRANNAVRINGEDLRCKVVGEGGNLGFTQRGRVEFAFKGGRINTDALDNSAGVSCSDHEVNIKIALQAAMEKKKLALPARNKLLASMTDEVAELVLADNHYQNQALSAAEAQGHHILESRARVIRAMERTGLLNREIEYLPSDEELAERRAKKQGFTRPELAVILAYSKLALYEEILRSNLPDDAYFSDDLVDYFPQPMQKKFAAEIENHQLRREIVATVITNSMINRVGSAFFLTTAEDLGVSTCDVARAFVLARDAFNLNPLWEAIEDLTGSVPAWTQAEMFVEIGRFVDRMTGWFLRNVQQPLDISAAMKTFESGIDEFMKMADSIMSPILKEHADKKFEYFANLGVPNTIAKRIASLEALASACDVVQVSQQTKLPIKHVGEIYFDLGQRLRLGWLRVMANRMVVDSPWDRIAITAITNDLFDEQRRLTRAVLHSPRSKKAEPSKTLAEWENKNEQSLGRYNQFISDMEASDMVDFSMLVVAMRNIEAIALIEKKTAA